MGTSGCFCTMKLADVAHKGDQSASLAFNEGIALDDGTVLCKLYLRKQDGFYMRYAYVPAEAYQSQHTSTGETSYRKDKMLVKIEQVDPQGVLLFPPSTDSVEASLGHIPKGLRTLFADHTQQMSSNPFHYPAGQEARIQLGFRLRRELEWDPRWWYYPTMAFMPAAAAVDIALSPAWVVALVVYFHGLLIYSIWKGGN